eukprot:4490441-Prymnesium_polylepis.2
MPLLPPIGRERVEPLLKFVEVQDELTALEGARIEDPGREALRKRHQPDGPGLDERHRARLGGEHNVDDGKEHDLEGGEEVGARIFGEQIDEV